jgi:hypothetical protein
MIAKTVLHVELQAITFTRSPKSFGQSEASLLNVISKVHNATLEILRRFTASP